MLAAVNVAPAHFSHVADRIVFIRNACLADTLVMVLTTDRMQLLTRLLDVASLRQEVIAQNVANINTPGYSTLGVSFEDALKEAVGAGSPIGAVQARIEPTTGGFERADGNNVDMDLEVARLQKNALYFQVYMQMLANDLAQFRSAIKGQ